MKKNHILIFAALSILPALSACGGGAAENSGATTPSPQAGESARRVPLPATDQAHYENMVEMLRGKVPGLEIIETAPGTIEVRIRGGNQSLQTGAGSQEPLVVIDGMPQARRAGEVLMTLNPNDVASIDVLKDVSSTAIYGTRGANGVIIIRMVRSP